MDDLLLSFLIAWLPTAIIAVVAFLARNWIKERIARSIQFSFDAKLENLRSSLRSSESELSTLRDSVLKGRASRIAIIDAKRIEAVESVWKSIQDLGPFLAVSAAIASIKFEEAAKEAARNDKLRGVFKTLGSNVEGKEFPTGSRNARLYVSPLVWALFSAYEAVLAHSWVQLKMLQIGIADPNKFFNREGVSKLLKAALPNYSEFLDQVGPGGYHYLLEHLKPNF